MNGIFHHDLNYQIRWWDSWFLTYTDWWANIFSNVGATLFGALPVLIFFNYIGDKLRSDEERWRREQANFVEDLKTAVAKEQPAIGIDCPSVQDILDTMAANGLLTEARLDGINLTGRRLNKADLTGIRLRDAKLDGLKASDADFTDSQISGCSLVGALLCNAIFSEASMRSVNLQDADCTGARFTNEAFIAGAKMEGTTLTNANFEGAIFEHIKDNATLIGEPSLGTSETGKKTKLTDGEPWPEGSDGLRKRYGKK